MKKYNYLLLAQLALAVSATFGSLVFSEIMKFPPCDLCWYQRVFVYPMVFVLLSGIYLQSKEVAYYLFPLSVFGLLIAIYHNLVYYKIIEVIVPCSESAPCTAQQLNMFGFITIPLLSLMTFFSMLVLNGVTIWVLRKSLKDEKNEK